MAAGLSGFTVCGSTNAGVVTSAGSNGLSGRSHRSNLRPDTPNSTSTPQQAKWPDRDARGGQLTIVFTGNTVLPMMTITFKVTDDEARQIRSQARKEGLSVSEYLRRRASAPMALSKAPRRIRCSHTGAMIFAAPENQPPLTTELVRDLLSDFP